MTIAARLKLLAVLPALVAVAIAIALISVYRATEQARREQQAVRRVAIGVFELNDLVRHYLARREQRPRRQFQLAYAEVVNTLSTARFDRPEEFRLAQSLASRIGRVAATFEQITTNAAHMEDPEQAALARDIEDHLAGQVLIRSQEALDDAAALETWIDRENASGQQRIGALVIALLVAMTLSVPAVLLGIVRGVTRSLDRISKGVRIVGTGDLNHRIGLAGADEMGLLAQAFDGMTASLQATTVSRDRLAAEATERSRVQEELRASEARYRALVDLAPDAVIVEQDGRFAFANAAALNLLGASSLTQLMGQTVLDHVHPDDQDRVAGARDSSLAGREFELRDVRLRRFDGSFIWTEGHSAPVDFDGKPAIQIVIHDITERRRIDQDLRRHMAELQAANAELARFNEIAVGRELRMIELKRQVNDLCIKAGMPRRYDVAVVDGRDPGRAPDSPR